MKLRVGGEVKVEEEVKGFNMERRGRKMSGEE